MLYQELPDWRVILTSFLDGCSVSLTDKLIAKILRTLSARACGCYRGRGNVTFFRFAPSFLPKNHKS